MDERTLYETTKAAFADALAERPAAPRMMRIDPFDALDEAGDPVRVIGVYDDQEDMRFVIIVTESDGEIYPIAARSIYKMPNAQIESQEV